MVSPPSILHRPPCHPCHTRYVGLDLVKEKADDVILFQLVIEQVCRLARVIASPHQVAHCTLVAEGCPGRVTVVAKLAANLCGFTVVKINPSPVSCPTEYGLRTFRADLVAAYMRAGVRVGVEALISHQMGRLQGGVLLTATNRPTGVGPFCLWTNNIGGWSVAQSEAPPA